MESDKYLTLAEPSTGIFRDRGSRFLAYAYPADTAEQCMAQLEKLKQKHHDARHHCFAYRLSPEKDIYRYSDDGEPNGTAGRPIYEQILSHNLYQVHVVVVRYFGGTLLGAGGLYQAYKNAAAEALSAANIIETYLTSDVELLFSYSIMTPVMKWLDREQPKIIEKEFTDTARIVLRIRKSETDNIMEKLKKISGLQVSMIEGKK